MADRTDILQYLSTYLSVDQFQDYCPNGLQIEGKSTIAKIISGVTACQALIDIAIEKNADALLVHHGYFWRGENAEITSMKQRRIKSILAANINLFAYHLPLDAHPIVGNNAVLAQKLAIEKTGQLAGKNDLVQVGRLAEAKSLVGFAQDIKIVLGRQPLMVAGGDHLVESVAWCTGAAQSYLNVAAAAGVDAYISGEISENTVHAARELGIHYIAAGHHATEQYGVQALGQHLAEKFSIEHEFVDIPNPV